MIFLRRRGGSLFGLSDPLISIQRYSNSYWCCECKIKFVLKKNICTSFCSRAVITNILFTIDLILNKPQDIFNKDDRFRLPVSAVLSGCVWSLPPAEQELSPPPFPRSCSRWLVLRIVTPLLRVPLVPLETSVSACTLNYKCVLRNLCSSIYWNLKLH